VSAATLLEFVGAPTTDEAFVTECWNEAHLLVDKACGTAVADVPAVILNRAKLECGSELYHRRSAPLGVSQFASVDGSAVRISRDPMVGAIRILKPFLPFGVA
jgi:hypothetical protein